MSLGKRRKFFERDSRGQKIFAFFKVNFRFEKNVAGFVEKIFVLISVRKTRDEFQRSRFHAQASFFKAFANRAFFRAFVGIAKSAGQSQKSFARIFRSRFKKNISDRIANNQAHRRGHIVIQIKIAIRTNPFFVLDKLNFFRAAFRTEIKFIHRPLRCRRSCGRGRNVRAAPILCSIFARRRS